MGIEPEETQALSGLNRYKHFTKVLVMVLLAITLVGALATIVISASVVSRAKIAQHTAPPKISGAQDIAQQFMYAFLQGHYHTMWSLLSPQVQALWPSETTYAIYWETRFRGYTLTGFTQGKMSMLQHWTDPETMIHYTDVVKIPLSLQLAPTFTVKQWPQAPPEDLHPQQVFQNLPFIVQRTSSRWLVLEGGPADLEAPILPPMNPVKRSIQVPILMYHHITTAPTYNVLDESLTVVPSLFTQQMDYLKSRNYHTITYNQFFDALYYSGPLPTRPILLTFDDGHEDNHQFAFPILQAHSFSGMFFIITGKIGWQGQMSWLQLRQMQAGGMQIGSHTIHHVDLNAMYLDSPVLAQHEMQQSQMTLEQGLRIPIQQFCYPSGEPFHYGSVYVQHQIVSMLAADGYVGGTTDPGATGTWQSSQLPFELLRVRVDGRESLLKFIYSLPWH
jgi:peptidoglycan/xylan/chitin deacetylase (PgdA/CDA1 family)